jgi:hypothetical protein
MKTWQDLLTSGPDKGAKDYGPQSQAVLNLFGVLSDMPWLEKVGEPLEPGVDVATVTSWDQALARPDDDTYEASGHLRAPAELAFAALSDPQVKQWWDAAREDAYDHYDVTSSLPVDFDARKEDVVDLYIQEFVGYVLAEILGVPAETSTHFRQLLSLFNEGHYPCGWDGQWPQGRPRVF